MKAKMTATAAALGVLILAGGVAIAQPWGGDGDDMPMHGMMGHHRMGGGMMGGMMGGGMMGHGMMSPMMFALMDTDGDGAISFAEMEAVHKRLFDMIDQNKDGKVTPEEMRSFWRGPAEDQ